MKTWEQFATTSTYQVARIDYLETNNPEFAQWWKEWEGKLNRVEPIK